MLLHFSRKALIAAGVGSSMMALISSERIFFWDCMRSFSPSSADRPIFPWMLARNIMSCWSRAPFCAIDRDTKLSYTVLPMLELTSSIFSLVRPRMPPKVALDASYLEACSPWFVRAPTTNCR